MRASEMRTAMLVAVSGLACLAQVPSHAAAKPTAKLATLDKALSEAINRENANPNQTNFDASLKAAEAVIAAADGLPAGPDTAPYLARALVSRSGYAREAGDIDKTLADAERAREVILPYRDLAPDAYVQAIALAGDVAIRRALFQQAADRLSEGAAYLEQRRGKGPSSSALDMGESNIGYTLAIAYMQLGQYDASVKAQEASLAARVRGVGEFHPATISARYNLALRLSRAGRLEEAEAMARLAAEQVKQHVPQTDLGHVRAVETLALVLAGGGKRSEAVEVARHALDIRVATTGTGDVNFAASLTTLGGLLADLGRYDEAVSVLTGATSTQDKLGPLAAPTDRLRALTFLGFAQLGQGKMADARRSLDAAYEIWEKTRAAGAAETFLPAVALARLDSGDEAGAVAAATAHLAVASGPRAPVLGKAQSCAIGALLGVATGECGASPGFALVRTVTDRLDASADGELVLADRLSLELAMRLALRDGDVQLAADASQVLVGSKVARATRLAAARAGTSDPVLSARIRTLQDAELAYRRANSVYLLLLGNGGDVQSARSARDVALAKLEQERAGIASSYPAWAALTARQGVPLTDIRSTLANDEAVLAVVPALTSAFVLLVSPDRAVVQRMEPSRASFASSAARLRRALDQRSFDAATSHELYRAIFAGIAPDLRKTGALRIIAGGDAAAIPFATLLERPVDRIDRKAPFLVMRYALSAGASLQARTVQPRRALAGSSMLALGAPTPFGTVRMADAQAARKGPLLASAVFRGGQADAQSLASLPALRSAEVDAVSRSVGKATVLTGDQASEEQLAKTRLDQYGVLLFATHALVAGEMEGVTEPALVLARPEQGASSDGVLTASEIGKLRLDADWVILSACNTAAGDGEAAPAYSGLAQAFRYAGARTLMLSHWPVRDDAAAVLAGTVLKEAAKGRKPAHALRTAMLRTMVDPDLPDAANPHVWAPFVVFE